MFVVICQILSVVSRSIICRSRRLRQIIDLRDTDKSRYFAITEFNNCFIYIIRSRSLFFKQERSPEGEKRGFIYMSRIVFAAKNSWTTLRMSTPLFVGSYLRVTWWALGQWKGRNICIEWKLVLADKLATSFPGFSERETGKRGNLGTRLISWLIMPSDRGAHN